MARPFLSLILAAVSSAGGIALASTGAIAHATAVQSFRADQAVGPAIATLVGVMLFALAAASLAVHWVGALIVGSIHALLGLLALVVPFGNPFGGGIFSPVFQITRMLTAIDRSLSDGAMFFYFSGTALVVGAFLAAAALGIRSRRLSGWSTRKAVAVSSTVGGVALLGAVALLLVGGGQFMAAIFQRLQYVPALAALAVVAGLLAGVAGLLLRWSSLGVFIIGGLVTVLGVVLFLVPTVPPYPGRMISDYGLLMIAGATFVGAALGGLARSRTEVTDDLVDL